MLEYDEFFTFCALSSNTYKLHYAVQSSHMHLSVSYNTYKKILQHMLYYSIFSGLIMPCFASCEPLLFATFQSFPFTFIVCITPTRPHPL